MSKSISIALVFLFAASCEEDGGDRCEDATSVTGAIVSAPISEPVVADLLVRGTVTAPANATIYAVQVNGIDATTTTGNFRTWSATVPIGVLAASPVTDGKIALTAVALTNCASDPVTLATKMIAVDGARGTIDNLAVNIAIPNGATYLPATKPISAIVTVSAKPQAAGATVALTATSGTLSATTATLSGDGVANASAQVLFSSTMPGTAVIVATAQGKSAVGAVTVIGAPTFAPDGTAIRKGDSELVTVVTAGKIDACQASPAAGIHVTSGATDLMAAPGGVDETADGLVDIHVAVDAAAASTATTTLVCRDLFGQSATAAFTVAP